LNTISIIINSYCPLCRSKGLSRSFSIYFCPLPNTSPPSTSFLRSVPLPGLLWSSYTWQVSQPSSTHHKEKQVKMASYEFQMPLHFVRVAYTRHHVPWFQNWEGSTSHNVYTLQISDIFVYIPISNYPNFSNPQHLPQVSNNSFLRIKSIFKFINTWHLLNSPQCKILSISFISYSCRIYYGLSMSLEDITGTPSQHSPAITLLGFLYVM
jgi:hypothetical protein